MYFQTRFFIVFFPFWLPKMAPKSMMFSIILKNVDFVKIMVFLKENCYFSGFEPTKNDQKSMPTSHSKNSSKKTSQNSILGPFWLSKTFEKPPKSFPEAKLNRACFATLWKSRGNRQKVTGLSVCKASKGLRI